MKKNLTAAVLATASATVMATASYAADSVNAAFFLEWASPNQVAKVDKAYDSAMGVEVNWTDFPTGVQMTEAMLAGDIDISYSQGLAPFVTAIQQGAPLKMVAVAMMYEANDCFVKNGLGIDASNASELEGKTIAVPLNTMADFAFKSYMNSLDVDMSTMTIVDQAPADGAVSLADGSVDMACIFGGNSAKAAGEVGTPIMTSAQKVEAGIGSFDVVSVTEKFATENPDLLRTFLDVTNEANAAYAAGFTDAQLAKVAKDAGMSVEDTRSQLEGMIFLSEEDQKDKFFGDDGIAASAAAALGVVFSDASDGASIAKTIDASFLD
ncbi:MAG: ABC transporter substrate-binding protein [Paracoccaceae bacterium]|nr:ABC transporter substrate-binding protein [Paracoccaceae bacterium]